MVAKENVDFR